MSHGLRGSVGRGRIRNEPWSSPLVLCGVSSREDDDDDDHSLIRGHDGCWTQTGRIQEAVLNLDKQMGCVPRIADPHLPDEEGLKSHHSKHKKHPGQHGRDHSYVSKARGDVGHRSDRHRAAETQSSPGRKSSPDRFETVSHDDKGIQYGGEGKGSPRSGISPPLRALKCKGVSHAETVDDLANVGVSCDGRVSVFRENFEHMENGESVGRSENVTSSRRARVERNLEEDLQIKCNSLSNDSKRKSSSPSIPQCRNRKSGHPHKSLEAEGFLKSEKAPSFVETEEQMEGNCLESEALSALVDSTSGSEAAGAAAGICFFDPGCQSAEGADVCQSQPQHDMGPDSDDYNPLRPEYAPFKEISEGRQRIARQLHREISSFVSKNDMQAEESRWFRNMIVDKVRHAAQSCWENCSVEVYGSCSTNLFLPHSDVDLVVTQGSGNPNQVRQNLQRLAEKLQTMEWCLGVRPIDKTSVPVIKMEADISRLDEGHRLAFAMGLHPRLGAESALSVLDGDALAGLLGQLGWSPSNWESGPAHRSAEVGKDGKEGNGGVLMASTVESEAPRCRIAVDITFYSSQIKKNLLQHHGVVYSPLHSRNFINEQLSRYPAIRPLVLVLKHFLFRSELNDAYSGGLSSHSLILLLVFYFNNLEVEGAVTPVAPGADIPTDCSYGEWLLRVLEWLSKFPFDTVGIPVGTRNQFVALNSLGQCQLSWYCNSRRYCSPQAVGNWMRRVYGPEWDQQQSPFLLGNGNVKSGRIADEPPGHLHIEDPFSQGFNLARNSWKWMHAIGLFQRAHEQLTARCSAADASGPAAPFNPMEIYLTNPVAENPRAEEEPSLLESVLDRPAQ